MAPKNNDVLEEQIKMLFEITKEIKQILTDMSGKSVSKDQLETAIKLHEAQSSARHSLLEADIVTLKRIIYTLWSWVILALGKSFAGLFAFIIK